MMGIVFACVFSSIVQWLEIMIHLQAISFLISTYWDCLLTVHIYALFGASEMQISEMKESIPIEDSDIGMTFRKADMHGLSLYCRRPKHFLPT